MSTGSATGSEESRETIVLRSRRATMNKILDAFDVGDAERFAKLWETNIPALCSTGRCTLLKRHIFWRVCILSHVQWLSNITKRQRVTKEIFNHFQGPYFTITQARHSHVVARELERFKLYLEGEGGDVAGREQR